VVDIQTVSIAIASAGVFLAAIYYILQIRHQSKTRQMSLLINLYSTWGSDDMKKAFGKVAGLEIKDYNDFVKSYGSFSSVGRSPVWVDIDKIGWFFNGIGFLVHGGFADIGQIDDLFPHSIMNLWEILKPLVEGLRKQYNTPKTFQWFEYLYNEMKKREQRK